MAGRRGVRGRVCDTSRSLRNNLLIVARHVPPQSHDALPAVVAAAAGTWATVALRAAGNDGAGAKGRQRSVGPRCYRRLKVEVGGGRLTVWRRALFSISFRTYSPTPGRGGISSARSPVDLGSHPSSSPPSSSDGRRI